MTIDFEVEILVKIANFGKNHKFYWKSQILVKIKTEKNICNPVTDLARS